MKFAKIVSVAGLVAAATVAQAATLDVTGQTNVFDANNVQIGTLSYSVTGGQQQSLEWTFNELAYGNGDALNLTFFYNYLDKLAGNTFTQASASRTTGNLLDGFNSGSFGISPDKGISVSSVVLNYTAATAPVPEPESYAMLLAGLGVMGFVARRRQKRD